MNLAEVERIARQEIADENFRRAVDEKKEWLRRRRWWHVLFPWVITITRRD